MLWRRRGQRRRYAVTLKIPQIRLYNLNKLRMCSCLQVKLRIKKCALTSFFVWGMLSEGSTPKNGEPAFGFSSKTMPQHTGRFRSELRTMWQYCSIPILSWPGFNWFLCAPSTEISIDGTALLWCTDIIKNATEELKRLSQNSFQ
jgi:hypothetical protein